MNNLGCYRNLKPDPHSAPALLKSHQQPEEESKRQLKLKNNQMITYQTRLKAKKKANKKAKNPENDENAKKEEKIGERKFQKVLEADFNKNLWTSKILIK